MKYPQFLHWSDGQFLQPHHFQVFQRSVNDAVRCVAGFTTPYSDGLCSLSIDRDALHSRRVVVNSFSAVMPDGTFLSMPGNCSVNPLTVDLDLRQSKSEFTVYLALPYYVKDEPNLSDGRENDGARYLLHEQSVADENTGDNQVTIITRKLNVRLITDPKKYSDCSVLPVMKLSFVSVENHEPELELCDDYIPPYMVLDRNSSLFIKTSELVFELKSCKSKILSDIEATGFDPNLITGAMTLKLMQLQLLGVYINTLSSYLIPEKTKPFDLYLQLSNLLSSLRALYPLTDSTEIPSYDHYNLFPVFSELFSSIRALINTQGRAGCIELEFTTDSSQQFMFAELSDEHIIKASDYYIVLQGDNNWKDLISDIEKGDNFRLIDKGSKDSRVRGIKLSYVRFPPRYLPMKGSDSVCFRLMREESPRVWRYMLEDHQMVIDYATNLFKPFKATLYMAVVE